MGEGFEAQAWVSRRGDGRVLERYTLSSRSERNKAYALRMRNPRLSKKLP